MTGKWTLWSALLGLGGWIACSDQPPPVPRKAAKPQPVAVVNGRQVYRAQYQAFLTWREDGGVTKPARDLFREFITHRVLIQAAEKEGVTIVDSEVRQTLEQWLGATQPATPELLEQARGYLTIQKFIRSSLSAESQVSLPEMQRYYEVHADQFVTGDQVRVLEILVKEERVAEGLRRQLTPGDFRTFREMARRHSGGATAKSGGELGVFERGVLPTRFGKLIFSLKVGELSPVFRSDLGYHIFTVEERIPRHAQKFYEVRKDIFETLIAQKERAALDQFVAKLLQSASIEVLDESLSSEWRHNHAQLQ
ncbi:MAG: peptidylprolyl isomerase [Acidobacteriota bacterium]